MVALIRPLIIGVGYVTLPKSRRVRWLKTSLESAGPTYIKLGQFIANRRDVFGAELSDGLRDLQDKVQPLPWDDMKPFVPIDAFQSVDPVPLATASVAQVHKAVLPDGTACVVKIKKPGVQQSVSKDIEAIRIWARVFMSSISPGFIDDFERSLTNEFDFLKELSSLQIFADMYAYSAKVVVPRAFPSLCTDSILTMTFVPSDGPPTDSRTLVSIFIQQLLFETHIHGDLHSGNIGSSGSSVILYDFGNVIRTTSKYRRNMMDFIYYLQTRDAPKLIETIKRMGMVVLSEETTVSFIKKFFEYIETADISAFTFDPDEIQEKIPIQLDAVTISILRSYSLLEGYCKKVDPDFSYESILSDTLETIYLDMGYAMERARRDVQRLFTD